MRSTNLMPVSLDSAFHLSGESQAFHIVRHTTLIFGFSSFLLLLGFGFFDLYNGLCLTCLFLFMCAVTLGKGYFSNLAVGAESS